MNFIWTSVVFSLTLSSLSPSITSADFIVFHPPSGDQEYISRSIFSALKERNGQFSSEIQTYEYSNLNTSDLHRATVIRLNSQLERYSFATNSGLYVVPDSERALSHLYLNGKEIHSYREGVDDGFCDSRSFSRVEFQRHLGRWVPLEIFDLNSDYNLLGLNVLLELLYRVFENEKARVRCEPTTFEGKEIYKWTFWADPRECTIAFGETHRLVFRLISNQNYTDYPTEIQLHQRSQGEWELKRQFKYLNFSPSFDEEPVVGTELPGRKACKRMHSV